jgi:hypothetical protein
LTLRERILFGASPRRLPFDLRDLRELLLKAREYRPLDPDLLGLIKQVTRVVWPTEEQLSHANAVFRALDLPESKCPTREHASSSKPVKDTPAEIRESACAAFDALCAARPLKPPKRAADYEPVPSEVLKLRAKSARPDHEGFRLDFARERT